jgi:molecular chaperone GrpE
MSGSGIDRMKSKDGEESAEDETRELKGKLEAAEKRNEDLLTRLKYMQADLENYRKRMDRELAEARDSSVRSLLTRLLVVQDEMDMAARHSDEGGENGEVKEGFEMVRKKLESALESAGVERIECVGKPFDPTLHEAVEKVQGESSGEDTVVEEVRPGFMFKGQLLRPSMVKVELASKQARQEAKVSE